MLFIDSKIVLKMFGKLSAAVNWFNRVLLLQTPYIYGGMTLSILSLAAGVAIGGPLFAAIAAPVISALLFMAGTSHPHAEEITAAALGWSTLYILFVFG